MEYVTLKKFAVIPSIAVCLLGISLQVSATPYTLCGEPSRVICVAPVPDSFIPPPPQVTGKEISTNRDRNAGSAVPGIVELNPEQNIAWDGIGGTANTFDYSGSRTLANGSIDQDWQVDALANKGDALYNEVIDNLAALLFSVDDDPNIYSESTTGVFDVWADQSISSADGAPGSTIDDMLPIFDTDGLEVWGGDGPDRDDANNYSLEFDVMGAPDPNGVAVWSYLNSTNTSTVNWLTSEIVDIVNAVTGIDKIDLQNLNLDAMMTLDSTKIMFSVDPLAGLLDGGEIFVGVRGGVGSSFLNHGGHLWDTGFDVSGTFGLLSENINALEAVATDGTADTFLGGQGTIPEPGTLSLISLAGVIFLFRWRQRVAKAARFC